MDSTKEMLKKKNQIAERLSKLGKQMVELQDEIRSAECEYRRVLDAIYAPNAQR